MDNLDHAKATSVPSLRVMNYTAFNAEEKRKGKEGQFESTIISNLSNRLATDSIQPEVNKRCIFHAAPLGT